MWRACLPTPDSFWDRWKNRNVEYIEGLSPAISIDQKTTSENPRSTVGTVTEIYDYLRLMYARIGVPHCPVCGKEISSQSVDQIVDSLMELGEKTRITMLAPVVRQRKGEHEKILERIRKEGFTRVRVDGEIRQINEEEIKLEKNLKHIIEIVIDRIIVKEGAESRLSEACELAISHGDGLIVAHIKQDEAEYDRIFSTSLACPEHGVSIAELEPRMFSFNNPFGDLPGLQGAGIHPENRPGSDHRPAGQEHPRRLSVHHLRFHGIFRILPADDRSSGRVSQSGYQYAV